MEPPFYVSKQKKSVILAILLSVLFGPLGLLYATVSGGLLMLVLPIIFVIILFAGIIQENEVLVLLSSGLLLISALTFWLVNIIWAVISVNNYNEEIDAEAKRQYEIWRSSDDSSRPQNIIMTIHESPEMKTSDQAKKVFIKPTLREWLKSNPGMSINDYYSKFGK